MIPDGAPLMADAVLIHPREETHIHVPEEGFSLEISRSLLDQLGWAAGSLVAVRPERGRLTLTLASTPEEQIRRAALGYLVQQVGDATTAGTPEVRGAGWRVPVFLSYADQQVGVLEFSPEGVLNRHASTSPGDMRHAAEAAANAQSGGPRGGGAETGNA